MTNCKKKIERAETSFLSKCQSSTGVLFYHHHHHQNVYQTYVPTQTVLPPLIPFPYYSPHTITSVITLCPRRWSSLSLSLIYVVLEGDQPRRRRIIVTHTHATTTTTTANNYKGKTTRYNFCHSAYILHFCSLRTPPPKERHIPCQPHNHTTLPTHSRIIHFP